jgi:arylsulfatase A-like enzyme
MRLVLLGLLAACQRGGPDPVDSTGTGGPADSDPPADTDVPEALPIVVSPDIVLPNGRPKNLVLVSFDTLRRDRLERYGYDRRATAPGLELMMKNDAVVFDDHRSCSSWTYPSMVCALTGSDQLSAGFWPPNNDGLPPEAPDDLVLLAERLHDAGFYTMLSGGSGFLGTSSNMEQGIDAGRSEFDRTATQVVDDALTLMADRPIGQPFFLHVHFLDPHMPYNPPEAYLAELATLDDPGYDLSTKEGTLEAWKQWDRLLPQEQDVVQQHLEVRYDGEIAYADAELARLVRELRDDGVWEDTLFVFFADHGEEFWEHLNFNHGYTAYEEVTRSVAFLAWPDNLEPARVASPTVHEDLVPTLLSIFRQPVPDELTGIVAGQEERPAAFNLTWRMDRTVQSVTKGRKKLIFRWDGSDALGGPKYFYDLAGDPRERTNLYDPENPDVIAMWALLEPEVRRLMALEPEVPPAVSPGP